MPYENVLAGAQCAANVPIMRGNDARTALVKKAERPQIEFDTL